MYFKGILTWSVGAKNGSVSFKYVVGITRISNKYVHIITYGQDVTCSIIC